MGFFPDVSQLVRASLHERFEQPRRLPEILVSLSNSDGSVQRQNEFVDGVALGCWYLNVYSGPVQDHSLSRLVNQKVEEAQRLRVGLQGRELLGLVGVGSLVRRYEIHAQTSLCDVTGREPVTRRMGDFPEGLVDFP